MTTEFGALGGIFPVDEKLISWYRAKATTAAMVNSPTRERINHERIDELEKNRLVADPGAVYAKELYMNLSALSPFISGPSSVKVANPLSKLEPQNIEIQKAYLVYCTNSRASDIANAARVFREASKNGEAAKVHPNVEFYLAAASKAEQKTAEEAGDWQVLEQAGAKVLPSGCAVCIGLGAGLLVDGERAISASNRNFVGRLGSRVRTEAYLGSPEVVAASAIQGKIAGPNWYQRPEGVEKVIIGEGTGDYAADKATAIMDSFDKLLSEMDSVIAAAEGTSDDSTAEPATAADEDLTDVLPEFPEKLEGEILFLDQDQLNRWYLSREVHLPGDE
ncbi:mitochondrial Homoaconitase [Neonectria magnoliae]|uniref:Mitochondrial Homoaconitase n=1 Tax=Neonectria magnoliae TaxID=2732573 RepID=A0ABR1HCX7_9HYPO